MSCGLSLAEVRRCSLAQLKLLDAAARRVEARRALLQMQVVNGAFNGNKELVERLRTMMNE